VRWDSGDYKFVPKLRAILPNTTTAAQTLTLTNETLGSSNGSENQTLRTTRAPILKNQQLEVREPELPSDTERAAIEAEEGEDAITMITDAAGRPREIWVRWHQVPDFYASGSRDRHYVLDHLTGEIRFGDGTSGRIPPIGVGNIRMVRYQTGGGVRGNRAATTIVQLKTTVPYVDKVSNSDAASGGADAEALDSLITRAPRTIRHRDRAVTLEDYEDLAMLASPQIARARCVPLYDLAADPDATQPLPGTVSVMIVPRSASPKPLASLELINRVQSHLDAHRIPTSDLVTVGPDYVRVDVQVEIALTSLDLASAVEMAVTAALRGFLHPLTGGLGGTGWDFGRQPFKSDVYALLEPIPGVDHVRTLNLTPVPDRPGADKSDRFLVYAGKITTTLIFEEA
jgi:predicted phage baseplate assembly protein